MRSLYNLPNLKEIQIMITLGAEYNLYMKSTELDTYARGNGNAIHTEDIAEHFCRNTFINTKCTIRETKDKEFCCSYITFPKGEYYIALCRSKDGEGFKICIMDTFTEEYSVTIPLNQCNYNFIRSIVNGMLEYMCRERFI